MFGLFGAFSTFSVDFCPRLFDLDLNGDDKHLCTAPGERQGLDGLEIEGDPADARFCSFALADVSTPSLDLFKCGVSDRGPGEAFKDDRRPT